MGSLFCSVMHTVYYGTAIDGEFVLLQCDAYSTVCNSGEFILQCDVYSSIRNSDQRGVCFAV